MLHYAVVFFVIALIAAFLGFSGVAAGAAGIAKILFFVFLVVAVVSLLAGRRASISPSPRSETPHGGVACSSIRSSSGRV